MNIIVESMAPGKQVRLWNSSIQLTHPDIIMRQVGGAANWEQHGHLKLQSLP